MTVEKLLRRNMTGFDWRVRARRLPGQGGSGEGDEGDHLRLRHGDDDAADPVLAAGVGRADGGFSIVRREPVGGGYLRRVLMGAAYFYHLTREPLDTALPQLLSRALAAGWRVVVKGPDAARMDWLDEKLWLGPEDDFMPHGRSGGPHDADQPVLLTTGEGAANDPVCVMTVDGAGIDAEDVQRLERVCVLFDGNDPEAVDVARAQWKALTGAGCSAQYWSEESGRWEKKAEA